MVAVAGIDVGKGLEVWSGDPKRFDNSTAGISVLVDWLKEQDVSVAACEPTGGYERQLVQLDEAGLIPHMVHPVCGPSPAWVRGEDRPGRPCSAKRFPWRTRGQAGPGTGRIALTCCGAVVSWSKRVAEPA